MITIRRILISHNIARIAVLLTFVLSGCQSVLHSGIPTSSSASAVQQLQPDNGQNVSGTRPDKPQREKNDKKSAESEKLKQCQAQLEALKTMSPAQYKRMHISFDYLMNGAAQYTGIRQSTNIDTQDTVDALYRYRANLLCSQIAQALLDSLTSRGEARP